jgi:hypothetical protein
MEVVVEQFISSDRPKSISNILKSLATAFGVGAIAIMALGLLIIGVMLGIVALIFFIGSYLMYVDYEYELYNGDITITKVYNASRRKIARKINREEVRRIYLVGKNGASNKSSIKYYNTNLDGLNIYNFELSNNKVVQLALNSELEKIIKIIFIQKITS